MNIFRVANSLPKQQAPYFLCVSAALIATTAIYASWEAYLLKTVCSWYMRNDILNHVLNRRRNSADRLQHAASSLYSDNECRDIVANYLSDLTHLHKGTLSPCHLTYATDTQAASFSHLKRMLTNEQIDHLKAMLQHLAFFHTQTYVKRVKAGTHRSYLRSHLFSTKRLNPSRDALQQDLAQLPCQFQLVVHFLNNFHTAQLKMNLVPRSAPLA